MISKCFVNELYTLNQASKIPRDFSLFMDAGTMMFVKFIAVNCAKVPKNMTSDLMALKSS